MKALLTKSAPSQRGQNGPVAKQAHWLLLAVLAPPGTAGAAASRSDLVLIESMMHQFADLGLTSVVVPATVMRSVDLEQWRVNWNFDPNVQIDSANAASFRKEYGLPEASQLLLVSPSGQAVARWEYPIAPGDVWLQIQRQLGTPAGTQQMPSCTNAATH
jgi:hypothetical protein